MKNIYFLILFPVLVSCVESDNHINTEVSGYASLSDKDKAIYAEIKGIPMRSNERIDRGFNVFKQRVEVAKYLIKNELKENSTVRMAALESQTNALIDGYFDDYLQKVVTDDVLRNFYKENMTLFSDKKLHLAHIMLRINKQVSSEEMAKKRQLLEKITEDLKTGVDFKVLVEQYSEDMLSKKHNGDIGWLSTVNGDPQLLSAGLSLKVGEFSDPIKTNRGLHIITLLEEPVIEPQPYEKIKSKLRYKLGEQEKKKEWSRLLNSVNSSNS